jgi:phosphatidylserine decarboxylase
VNFAREGYPFVGGAALLAILAWGWLRFGAGGRLPLGIAITLSVLTLFTLWFFRDPDRPQSPEKGLVVAPGQGRVIGISQVDEPVFMGGPARKITIFLSIFDVHVQRAPVSGVVEYRHYRPGAFAVAWADKASEDNEQASLGITTEHGRVLVRQIAGLVARRIVTYPSEGDTVARGERIGLIRFGSRVDIFFPLDWEVACEIGDRVKVGATVLARQPHEVGS